VGIPLPYLDLKFIKYFVYQSFECNESNPNGRYNSRDNLGAFIEYLQGSHLKPSTINSYLTNLYVVFGFLIEQDVISPDLMRCKFRLRIPDELCVAFEKNLQTTTSGIGKTFSLKSKNQLYENKQNKINQFPNKVNWR